MSQVLDELGLNLSDELSSKRVQHLKHNYVNSTRAARLLSGILHLLYNRMPCCVFITDLPSTGGSLSVAGGKKVEPQAALADADADLEARLNNLRRD